MGGSAETTKLYYVIYEQPLTMYKQGWLEITLKRQQVGVEARNQKMVQPVHRVEHLKEKL